MSSSEESSKISDVSHDPAPAAGGPGPLNAAAMTVEQLARVLSAVGSRHATVEAIGRHIQAGAPALADGRVNLMHYMSWLIRELADGEN